MVLKQIKNNWWTLTSDDGISKLIWFGYSREEVLGKFRAYVRDVELDRVRYRPKGVNA